MGFLDRMVSDMIRRQTGFNARRIVRRVGGRNILLMGAAAVAGGLLTEAARSQSAGATASGQTAVPPRSSSGSGLPPIPQAPAPADTVQEGAAPGSRPAPDLPPVPDLPPLPGTSAGAEVEAEVAVAQHEERLAKAEAEASEPPRELLYAILRTMVAAALVDGVLEPGERQVIEGRMREADLSTEQAARVLQDLSFPATTGELAALLPEGEDPETLLQFGVLIARADAELSDSERQWLHGFADALRVPRERVDVLEREIFPEG